MPHQEGDAVRYGSGLHVQPVRFHDRLIVQLMGFTQLREHGQQVVEVGEGTVGIERAGIQNPLRRLDFHLLLLRRSQPQEVIVDDVLEVAVIAIQASYNLHHPRIMNIRRNIPNSNSIAFRIREK